MSRRLAILLLAVVTGCNRHDPPRGSGDLETTASSSTVPTPVQVLRSSPRAVAYPNGAVLTLDPATCRGELFHDGKRAWAVNFADCAGLLEPVVALDSVAYVRGAKSLWAVLLRGAVEWTIPIESTNLPLSLAAPTALPDSRVAIAVTPSKIVTYEHDGSMAWSFSTPAEEALVSPPVGMKTEGLTIMTSAAEYLLAGTGEIRWRVTRNAPLEAER
jgi:hypothetical protein